MDRSRAFFKLLIALTVVLVMAANGARQSVQTESLPPLQTVFIILEENQNWSAITPSVAPYIRNTLLPMGAHAEQYYNPPGIHPSEPNYVWIEAGGSLGIADDADPASNHRNNREHLVAYLDQAGISWKAYAEDIDGKTCPLTSRGQYAAKHVPFLFFDDVTGNNDPNSAYCISHIRPYSELARDLEYNTVARYNFITPNLCNDMHNCGITAGDRWLSSEVPKILGSQSYKEAGVLFITWDEGADAAGNDSDGPIGMIALSPFAKVNYSNSIHYTHSSILKTLQEIFGVLPNLRDAANTTDLSDFFVSGPPAPASINDGGIVNAASYNLATAAAAPGEIVTIFGTNLTDGRFCMPPSCHPAFGSNGLLNTTMAGSQVTVNGRPVPILYSSPHQLGIQIPMELAGASAAVQVTVAGQTSLSRIVSVAPVAPGLFTWTSDAKGSGAITHADGSPVTSQNPANPGEPVILYATGLGQVAPHVPTGAVPAEPSVSVLPVTVTIDGIVVIPDFSGLASCCVALNQINLRLPLSTRSGGDVPIVLTIGGVQSNTVTIAIR